MDENSALPPLPPAPPTVPGPVPQQKTQSSWPVVLGTIAVVLATLSVLAILIAVVTPMLTSNYGEMFGEDFADQMRGLTLVGAVVSACVAVLLLAGGISLLRRRRRSIATIKIWAALKIIVTFVGTMYGLTHQPDYAAMNTQTPGGPPVGLMQTFSTVGAVLGILWGCALPVFMLLWFRRSRIKEETAGWA